MIGLIVLFIGFIIVSCDSVDNLPDEYLVPTISITTTSGDFPEDKETYLDVTVTSKRSDDDETFNGISGRIKLRGNSTLNYDKKAFKLKFDDKQHFLGLGAGPSRDFVLLAEYADLSMMRNTIAYGLARDIMRQSFVTDTMYVDLMFNGEHLGLYVLAEQTEVDDVRIDLDTSGEDDPIITDTGYLLELEADHRRRTSEGLHMTDYFHVPGYTDEDLLLDHTNFSEYLHSFEPAWYVIKSDTKSEAQVMFIQNVMKDLYDAVYQDGTEISVGNHLDLQSAVDMYVFQLVVGDNDANYSSMYLYKDKGGKVVIGPPWDHDLSFGNNSYYDGVTDHYMFHLLDKLADYAWFKEMVITRYDALVSIKPFDDRLMDLIDQNVDTYGSLIRADRLLWNGTREEGGWHLYNKEGIDDWTLSVRYLEEWIEGRMVWVDGVIDNMR